MRPLIVKPSIVLPLITTVHLLTACSARTPLPDEIDDAFARDALSDSGQDSGVADGRVDGADTAWDERCPPGASGVTVGFPCEPSREGARCGVTCAERDGGWPQYEFEAICREGRWEGEYRRCSP